MERQRQIPSKMIQSIAVIDIDSNLALYKPNQQKWVSSLQLFTQMPKENKSNSKIILFTQGLYLQINYCEKNRPPIIEIDFVSANNHEWIYLKMPSTFVQRYGNLTLCYKTQDDENEPLTDIQILITQRKRMGEDKQVFILPPGYKIINNNPIPNNYLIYKKTKSLYEQSFKPILLQKLPQQYHYINQALLPIFCFPEGIRLSKELKGFIGFNFILTQQNGDRIYANCLSFKQELEQSYKKRLNVSISDKIYYQKAICLLSKFKYTDAFGQCLMRLYRLSMSKNDIPFEKVIASFVANMTMPKQIGINGLSYTYGGNQANFHTNAKYPVISEKSIYCVLKFLPLHSIINIFQAILLEKKIIFVSQSKTILGYAVEAFLSFVFPFRWQHPLIPILPSTLKDYLSAPVPLIAGISPSMIDNTIQSDTIIVQMDNGTILNDEDLPPLPDKLQKQLKKRLQLYQYYNEDDVRQFLQNPESTFIFKVQEVQHPQFCGYLIRDCFFQFMLSFMKNYNKFWKVYKYKQSKQNSSLGLTQPQLLNDLFKVQDFLSDLGMSKVGSFGYKFTQGTIFTSFIERKSSFLEQPQLKFFDECLQRKKNKKDVKLIERIQNVRYIVVAYPEPQLSKSSYKYDKFPSILGKSYIKQQQISIDLDSVDQEQLDQLQQFLDEEFKLNFKLYQQSQASDVDYKIQSLLLAKNKIKYQQFKEKMNINSNSNRNDVFLNNSKIKNSRVNYQKINFFYKLYDQQNIQIQKILQQWPQAPKSLIKIVQIQNKKYFKDLLHDELYSDNEVYCIYQESIGYKFKNYQSIIKNNSKVLFLDRKDIKSTKTVKQNLKSSKRRIKYTYQVYVQHFKLKNFLNKIISQWAIEIFNFITNKIKQQNSNSWTLDTLVEWKGCLNHDEGIDEFNN